MRGFARFAGGALIAFSMCRVANSPLEGFVCSLLILIGIDLLAYARGE